MRRERQQVYRIFLVIALGAGLATLATGPERVKTAAPEKPAPIILATVMDSEVPDHCLLPPHAQADERPIGDQTANKSKKKIIACG